MDDFETAFLNQRDRAQMPNVSVPKQNVYQRPYAHPPQEQGIDYQQAQMETEFQTRHGVQLTTDMLPFDQNFVAASKGMYNHFEGEPFTGSDQEAAEYGVELMGEFYFNFAGVPATGSQGTLYQATSIIAAGDGKKAQDFIYLMDQYERLPTFGEGAFSRMFRNMLKDPSNWAAAATLGTGKILTAGGQQATKMTARQSLRQLAGQAMVDVTTEVAKRPGTYGAIFEGTRSAAEEQMLTNIERAAGYQVSPLEEGVRTTVAGTIGAAAGGALSKLGETVFGGVAEGAPEAISKAVTDYVGGAEGRMAERAGSVQLGAGFDPTMLADRAILAAKSFFGGDDPATPTVLLPPTDKPKAEAAGLDPEYRVTVGGFEPDKAAAVPIKLTPKNSEAVVSKMDNIEQEYPDPLSSPDNYAQMVARTKNADEISAPPTWMIEHANDTEKWAGWFNNLTPDQIEGARQGLAVQEDFKQAYTGGADETLTGQLMLWAILSRRMSAYPHEAGYLELAEAAQPFIKKAARGEWTEADSIAWKEMAMSIMPEEAGSPGRSATSNANAFGETWLRKMAATDESGVSALTRLHNMIADPNMSSKDIRRQYYTLADATGIGNKVLSFALLVSGRNDVVVLDRIQINTMWGGGDKIYDDIMMQFEGAQGLVQYEALERSLMTRVPDLYSAVGRPEDGSVGRYHWESWVLSSGQIVSHPTLEAVVGMGTKRPGANISPTELMPITEGRFHAKHSGVSFEKLPGGGSRFVYNTSGGEPYQFTRQELDAMFKEVFSKKSGVLPPDFPGVKAFEGGNIPWYEYEGVNRGKFDAIIAKYGQPKEDL